MKKITLLFTLVFCFCFSKIYSQDFLGLSTGNYSGITGVSLQPASIVDSRFKFDINLFSTGVNYSNNYFLLNRDALLKFNRKDFDDYATFKDRYLSQASLPADEKVFFNINSRTQMPVSFMVTTGKRSAIALNLQFRTTIQGRRITQDLAQLGFNSFNPSSTSASIDASGISINSLSWAEAGLTYGRVLYSSEKHFLKAAFTGKYLAGLSSVNLSSNDLQLSVNNDSTFNFSSSNVSYNHNDNANFNKIFDRKFDPSATAFGMDAGLVYEYRGNLDKFKYLRSDDQISYDALRRDVSKYIFKLGVSLLDVGMFRFDKPANVNSFSANINRWDIKNARYKTFSDFDTALAARVTANADDPQSYNVYLPGALSAQLDIKFVKGLFLNVMSYWPVSVGSTAGKSFDRYGFYTITPRYESRHFGVYIPYTVAQRNAFTDYNRHLLGATVRLGPVFIGSSNLGSMLFNKNLRAADVHLGFKIGVTYGKPNKSNKFLNTVFDKNQQIVVTDPTETYSGQNGRDISERMHRFDRFNPKLLLNYKDGNVYHTPDERQNVIIINNNYFGNFPGQPNMTVQTISDTLVTQLKNGYSTYFSDSLRQRSLEIAHEQNKIIADSVTKMATDSLKIKRSQLDSLIKSMQRLQIQMDSSNSIEDSLDRIRDSQKPTSLNGLQKANDSLRISNSNVREATATNAFSDTTKYDNAIVYSENKYDSSAAIKKKVKSETGRSEINKQANNSDTAKIYIENIDGKYYSSTKPSKKLDQEVIAANADQKYLAIVDSINDEKQTALLDRNSQTLKRALEEQNNLYNQYAKQSARLQNDIDRLNRRVSDARQNNQRNRVSYVPVPVPYNNSVDQRNLSRVSSPIILRDTVYIRDTVNISKTDTIINIVKDAVAQNVIKEINPETLLPEKTKEAQGFDYTVIPEQNVLFGLGKSVVHTIYESPLNFIAGVLEKNPDLQVVVTGHTDATGSKAINEKLSLQRAQAVSYYLMNKGVSKNQIIIKSLSSDKPAVTGDSKVAQSQNRRVVVKLTKAGR